MSFLSIDKTNKASKKWNLFLIYLRHSIIDTLQLLFYEMTELLLDI